MLGYGGDDVGVFMDMCYNVDMGKGVILFMNVIRWFDIDFIVYCLLEESVACK